MVASASPNIFGAFVASGGVSGLHGQQRHLVVSKFLLLCENSDEFLLAILLLEEFLGRLDLPHILETKSIKKNITSTIKTEKFCNQIMMD